MTALGDVSLMQLQLESRAEKALDSIKALLSHGGHDGGAEDVRLLFAASKAVPRHSRLWASALHSRALEQAIAALLEPCARADDNYKDRVLVSQMAGMQPKLQYMCHTFWQALAKHGTKALGARQTASTLHAYAKLVSQQQGSVMRRTGNRRQTQLLLQAPYANRLCDALWAAAKREARSMDPQNVANTLWALATLSMPPTGSLRDALWVAAERAARSMNPQNVANTMLAMATLNMPPTGSLREALWAAAEREARSMNPQNVANTVWAMATLNMPPTGSLREALWTAAEREAHRMNPQNVANSLYAFSLFYLHDTTTSRQVIGRLFERAAQLNENLGLEGKRQVRPALFPVCLFETSARGTQTIAHDSFFGWVWHAPGNDCPNVYGAMKCRCTMRFWCYSRLSATTPLSAYCNAHAMPVLFKLRS
jgi:hypothetical protein